jgi:hypothetical protein
MQTIALLSRLTSGHSPGSCFLSASEGAGFRGAALGGLPERAASVTHIPNR